MAERSRDHVALPDADQLVDEEAVRDVTEEAAAQPVPRFTFHVTRFPKDDIRVRRHRLSEDAALSVAGALGLGAGRGFQIVHEARSEEHTSELQSQSNLVCRLLL